MFEKIICDKEFSKVKGGRGTKEFEKINVVYT